MKKFTILCSIVLFLASVVLAQPKPAAPDTTKKPAAPAPAVQQPAPAVQQPAPAVQQPAPAVQQPAPTPAPATQKPAATPAPAVQKPAPVPEKKVEPAPAAPAAKKMVITAGVLGGVNYWMWSGKDDDAAGTKLTGSFMGFGGGAFVKVSGLIPYISPRVDVQYGTVDDKVSGKQVKITGITANLNLIYDIQTSGKIAPYVGVGGGGAMLNEKKPTTPNGADGNRFAINFVAGAAFQVNPKLSVGLDLGFVYDIDGQNNYVPIHVVVGYEF